MGKWNKEIIVNTFKLRARIGWQGLKAFEFTDEGPHLVTGTDFYNGKINWDNCYHVTETRYKQDVGIQLFEHDLLITKDGTIGKTAVVKDCPEKVTLNSGVFVVRPINSKVKSEYLYYILNSHTFNLFMKNILTGSTIKHLNQEHFYKFSFDYPEKSSEQEKIIEILSTVDIAIEKTKSLILKYKNIKEGLLQDLLTNGIDENGNIRSPETHEYKDSPLGKIPANWECMEFESLCLDMIRGPFGGALKKQDFVYSGYKVYEQGNAIYKTTDRGHYFISSHKYNLMKRFAVQKKDFIISCSGTIGEIYQIPDAFPLGIINQALLLIRLNVSIDKDYFLNYFNYDSFKKTILDSTQGGAMKNLVGMPVMRKLLIKLPPKKEQERIARCLNSSDAKILTEQNCLFKYESIKKGLMQDLLTHKVPVDCLL